jgi:serine/threonine protein kinase
VSACGSTRALLTSTASHPPPMRWASHHFRYWQVNLVTSRKTGDEYALKSIPKQPPNERESKSPEAYLKKIISEVRVMQHVGKSLNVVHLYEAFEDDTHVHLLLELCRGGEVRVLPPSWSVADSGSAEQRKGVTRVVLAASHCHPSGPSRLSLSPEWS